MNFNNVWREFINSPQKEKKQVLLEEGYREMFLLAEGQKDIAKKKCPITDQFGVVDIIVNQLRAQFGDRGVSRYTMFACKCMEKFYKPNTTQDDFGTYKLKPGIIATRFFENVMGTVVGFHESHQRLEEKDINKYTFESLWAALEALPESSGERKRRMKDRNLAERDSEVVYNQHDIIAVRPLTTQASCYYGENPRLTNWCISTKSKKNYFDEYTKEKGRAFVIVRFFGLPEEDKNHIISLEFDYRGEMMLWWDAPNRSFEPEDLLEMGIIQDHLLGIEEKKHSEALAKFQDPPQRMKESDLVALSQEIYNDLLVKSKEAIDKNAPHDPREMAMEKCNKIEAKYDQEYEYVNLYWDIVDAEIQYEDDVDFNVIYGAELVVPLDVDKPEYEGPDGNLIAQKNYKFWRELESKIEDVFTRKGAPWDDMVGNINCYMEDGYVKLQTRFSGYDSYHMYDPSGFEDFADQDCRKINNRGMFLEELLEHFLNEEIQSASSVDENEFYKTLEKSLLGEEKGRSRQRGIYKFYCMVAYGLTTDQEKSRGLDDILADLRALPNVTIVTVAIRNQKIAEGRYIAGLSIKFIPSTPGDMNTPENVKARIVRDIKRLQNVHSLFKLSTGLIRLE